MTETEPVEDIISKLLLQDKLNNVSILYNILTEQTNNLVEFLVSQGFSLDEIQKISQKSHTLH